MKATLPPRFASSGFIKYGNAGYTSVHWSRIKITVLTIRPDRPGQAIHCCCHRLSNASQRARRNFGHERVSSGADRRLIRERPNRHEADLSQGDRWRLCDELSQHPNQEHARSAHDETPEDCAATTNIFEKRPRNNVAFKVSRYRLRTRSGEYKPTAMTPATPTVASKTVAPCIPLSCMKYPMYPVRATSILSVC